MNRIFLDPIFRGAYPADVLEDVRGLGLERHIRDGDLATIATPIDVLGVNYYNGGAVSHLPPQPPSTPSRYLPADPVALPRRRRGARAPAGLPVTSMDWEVQPEGLTRLLVRLHEEYAGPHADPARHRERRGVRRRGGRRRVVDDQDRVGYVRSHLASVLDALDAGVPRAGLLLLVLPGQLRVGVGLRQALRYRPSGLRDAGTHAESQRLGPCPDHQHEGAPRREATTYE